jgi:serine phosphatase RsbU (regulator of sigma subunit)
MIMKPEQEETKLQKSQKEISSPLLKRPRALGIKRSHPQNLPLHNPDQLSMPGLLWWIIAGIMAATAFLTGRKLAGPSQPVSNVDPDTSDLQQRLQALEDDKRKSDEKNKKLWAMSEAVHKERRLVDEKNALLQEETLKLQEEKSKLQAEKTKVEEKVKKLWQTSTAVHQEKEKINKLKQEVELKHQEVIDSVNYAKRIQEAILPPLSEIAAGFKDCFVLFKPRDIVSGDFYWHYRRGQITVIAACDCTGHGVPGAFMSMIGNTLLNQIVIEKSVFHAGDILASLDEAIRLSLKQDDQESSSRDGMDVALCVIDYIKNEVRFAGANRPLYIFGDSLGDGFMEIKPSKFPIGGQAVQGTKKFDEVVIQGHPDYTYYLFSDGYADQFGGPHGKKFMLKNMRIILASLQNKSMRDQCTLIDRAFEEWRGVQDQIDDVLMIGFRP